MYCSACGKLVQPGANFCPNCGTTIAPYPLAPRRLFRSRSHRLIGGVCAGIALYNGWDIALVRVLLVLLVCVFGVGTIAYVIAWIVIPEEPLWLPAAVAPGDARTP